MQTSVKIAEANKSYKQSWAWLIRCMSWENFMNSFMTKGSYISKS